MGPKLTNFEKIKNIRSPSRDLGIDAAISSYPACLYRDRIGTMHKLNLETENCKT